jgi:flagellar biosynthesis protein FlgN
MIQKTWQTAEKLILDTLYLTTQLHEQLTQEADMLKSAPQVELIDSITAQKKQLISQLEGLNSQFSEVLTSEKLPIDQDGINQYFQRAEAAGVETSDTITHWHHLQLICSECKALNEQNAASIELLTLHAKRSLDILKGKTSDQNTYGRDGVTQSDKLSHTLTLYS